MKKIVICLAICLSLFSLTSQAVENKAQMGAVISSSKQLSDSVNLNASMVFINLMSAHAPYTSLSLSTKLNQHFSVGATAGYGFEEPDIDEGWFYGLNTSYKTGDLAFSNSLYYYQGLELWFSSHSLNYPLGFTRVGVDARNFYYTEEIDEADRSYQIGPAILIPFKDNFSLKFNYYYAFEPDGEFPEDSNIFKATVILSF